MKNDQTWVFTENPAEFYERYLVPAIYAQWAHQVATIAQIDQGACVLDAGCGTGVLARAAAKEAGQFGMVTGIDPDPGMVELAGRIAPDITWVQGDIQQLPFGDNHFDRVLSQFVLMFVPNRVAALKEMWRVLKPGGRLVFAVWESLDKLIAYSRLVRLVEEFAGPAAASALTKPWNLGSFDSLKSLVGSAGIKRHQIELRKGIARFPSVADFIGTEVLGTPVLNRLTNLQYNTILHLARRSLEPFRLPDGDLTIQRDAKIVSAVKA